MHTTQHKGDAMSVNTCEKPKIEKIHECHKFSTITSKPKLPNSEISYRYTLVLAMLSLTHKLNPFHRHL